MNEESTGNDGAAKGGWRNIFHRKSAGEKTQAQDRRESIEQARGLLTKIQSRPHDAIVFHDMSNLLQFFDPNLAESLSYADLGTSDEVIHGLAVATTRSHMDKFRRKEDPTAVSFVPNDAPQQDRDDMLLIQQAGDFLYPADRGDLGFGTPNVVKSLGCSYEEVGSSLDEMRELRRPVVGAWLRLNQHYPDTFGKKNPTKLLKLITLNGEIDRADAFAEFGVNVADHPDGLERPGILLAALPIPPAEQI